MPCRNRTAEGTAVVRIYCWKERTSPRLDDLSTWQENFILQTCLARELGRIEVEVGRGRKIGDYGE